MTEFILKYNKKIFIYLLMMTSMPLTIKLIIAFIILIVIGLILLSIFETRKTQETPDDGSVDGDDDSA